MDEPILEVKHLNAFYGHGKHRAQALFDVNVTLRRGEALGIVGESGSGKSTLAKCALGLLRDREGEITLGEHLPQMVFQDPLGSLNPMKTARWILEEPLRAQGVRDKAVLSEKTQTMLRLVGLSPELAERRPDALSGGQRQRLAIGAALIGGSKLIVLDEPVSALDVTLQAQILALLAELKKKLELSYLFISHDLAVVYALCERVAVMYGGRIVEHGGARTLYTAPQHPYTKRLLAASQLG